MDNPHHEIDKLLHSLSERAKELNCLYQIEELLRDHECDIEDIFFGIIKADSCRLAVSGSLSLSYHL